MQTRSDGRQFSVDFESESSSSESESLYTDRTCSAVNSDVSSYYQRTRATPTRLTHPGRDHKYPPSSPYVTRYILLLDVETSGRIMGVHSILAVAAKILGYHLDSTGWVVRIYSEALFTYPQDDMVFEEAYGGARSFWDTHSDVLQYLRRHATKHGLDKVEVTRLLSQWVDENMEQYGYPQLWSDNGEFDVAWINAAFGSHLGRHPMSMILLPDKQCRYFSRRVFGTQQLCMSMIEQVAPEVINDFDPHGTPNFMKVALKMLSLPRLDGLKPDHNPSNDADFLALNLGRLLCRHYERVHRRFFELRPLPKEWETRKPRVWVPSIHCFKYASETPLQPLINTTVRPAAMVPAVATSGRPMSQPSIDPASSGNRARAPFVLKSLQPM